MLTIAIVCTQKGWGGGEQQARLLARGLRAAGHACHLAARPESIMAQRMLADDFPLHPIAGRNPRGLWQLRRMLRTVRPDVLYLNDAHSVTLGGLAALGRKIPVRVAARRTSFPLKSPLQYRLLVDRVLCVGQGVADVCREAGLPSELLRVVYDGVDARQARGGDRARGRRAIEVDDDQPVLLNVGNLFDCKGHDYLLHALKQILPHHPRAVLALAGRGPMQERLERLADELGVAAHVRFLGFRDDVPDLIQAADVMVMSSLLEGIPIVLMEAMLAGCPLVTTSAGSILELVGDDEQLAWTVPPADAAALGNAIHVALQSPAERAARSRRAQRVAEQRFTTDRMVQNTLRVFDEVLNAQPLSLTRRAA